MLGSEAALPARTKHSTPHRGLGSDQLRRPRDYFWSWPCFGRARSERLRSPKANASAATNK